MDKRKIGIVLSVAGVLFIIFGFYIKPKENTKPTQHSTTKTELAEKDHAIFVSAIAHKFNKKYFAYTKKTNGFDLDLDFLYKGSKHPFALHCVYEKDLPQRLTWATKEQFASLGKQPTDKAVFVVIGVGGTALSPQHVFIVPLKELTAETIQLDTLLNYKKSKTEGNFYFDYKKGELR